MNVKSPTSIIWVGPEEGEALKRLAPDLRRYGFDLTVCENPHRLPQMLRRTPNAVIVVLDDSAASRADKALDTLQTIYREIPVVVVAEESTFGRYYELMRRGVRHFCEVSEAPEWIAQVVQHTAARAA